MENPEVVAAVQSTPQAPVGDQGDTSVAIENLLLPSSHEEAPVPETVSGEADQGGPEVQAEPVTRPQLATTSQELSTTRSGPSLQTYSPDLTRVRTIWSELVKRNSDFDAVLKVTPIIS